ncbi:MAG: helix-hairpin-helix domain-containing protein [Luteolibacter sp.]
MKWLILFTLSIAPLAAMESFAGSRYVPTDWADGDSFRVKTAEGREFTVRIYGADCFETGPYTPSDARRLRDQRRYFGISGHGGSFRASVELAERYGKLATAQVAEWLSEPFTVHTGFADARGDSRYERFYAFITMADGRDLSSALVANGLARAFGVLRAHPDGRTSHEYGQSLADYEMQAAVRRKGIWEHTDWDNLPEERRMLREYEEELRTTIRRPLVEGEFRVNPNTAARDELMRLPGIGESIAIRIIEARPHASAEALLKIPGIGDATLARIRPFIDFKSEDAGN